MYMGQKGRGKNQYNNKNICQRAIMGEQRTFTYCQWLQITKHGAPDMICIYKPSYLTIYFQDIMLYLLTLKIELRKAGILCNFTISKIRMYVPFLPLPHAHFRWIINSVEHIKISNIAHCSHHIYHCLNHPQARQKKVSDETIFQSIIHQKTIERLPLFLLHLSTSFWHRWWKMHQSMAKLYRQNTISTS